MLIELLHILKCFIHTLFGQFERRNPPEVILGQAIDNRAGPGILEALW
jgi:hypothetical protein